MDLWGEIRLGEFPRGEQGPPVLLSVLPVAATCAAAGTVVLPLEWKYHYSVQLARTRQISEANL